MAITMNNVANERPLKAVVIGAGVAGSAVAFMLSRLGHRVTLLWRADAEGSSFTNQKWHHSGLLYPSERVARAACRGFLHESLLAEFICGDNCHAKFLALDRTTLDEREAMWREWDVRSWGLNWRRLDHDEYQAVGLVGETRAVGGFEVPDRVVDFPRLVEYLREEVGRHGGTIIPKADVSRIRLEANHVTSVEFSRDGERSSTDCSLCVLASGAWTNLLLEASGITAPDLILRKCVVLEYDEELVPGLTTCLDISAYDKTLRDVTLVPFNGKTLAAGTGFTEVSTSDGQADPLQVERLRDQLAQCFPALASRHPKIVVCTKTEKRSTGNSNVQPQVYGREFHGVNGLAVAIPGKASFMFDLASLVLEELGL